LVVLFQPHRYSRTRDCIDDFAHAFDHADALFMTEIYPAGERPIPGVSGALLAERVRMAGHRSVTFIEQKETMPDQVLPHLKPGDLVLTLGAGDIWKAGTGILTRLERPQTA
jgi:UDP-N-acetylmuramate--alanine ligase